MSAATSNVDYFQLGLVLSGKRQLDVHGLDDVLELLVILFVNSDLRLRVHAHAEEVMAFVATAARDREETEAVAARHPSDVGVELVDPFEAPRASLCEHLAPRLARLQKLRLPLS